MERSRLFDKDISLLGFGLMRLPRLSGPASDIDEAAAAKLVDYAMANGVNYFDTAYTYAGSEAFAGRALSHYPRDSYYLATKCPPWKLQNEADFERIFAEQCGRCNTDYFDFYLVHNLAQENKRAAGNDEYFEKFEKLGMYQMLQRKKAEGKIRRIGFSFHGTQAMFERLIDNYQWDFVQIQLNYIDWTAIDVKSQYDLLVQRSIPIVIMEPLRGGTMATLSEASAKILQDERPDASLASWGIRYAASLPNVVTVLSGMSAMEQVKDNIATMNNFRPITDHEKELLDQAAVVFQQSGIVPCTACRYCMPCPEGVDIPRIFSIYNHARLLNFRIPFDNGYATLEKKERPSSCIQCGQCVEKCPQHLTIPEYLREIEEYANAQ